MENIENTKSGFKVESILLTESQFSRKGNIDFSNSKQEVSFETGVGTKGSVVNVKLTTTVTNKLQDEVQYKIEVTMVGVFKRMASLRLRTMRSLDVSMVQPSSSHLFESTLLTLH